MSEIVKEMADELESETQEQTTPEEPQANPEPEPEQQVISEELAREAGVHHDYVGKPITELAKALRAKQAEFTRASQELAGYKKAKPEPVKEEVEEEMPDPLEEPEKWKKWYKNDRKRTEDRIRKEVESKFSPLQKEKTEQLIKDTGAALYEIIPDKVALESAIIEHLTEWEGINTNDAEAVNKFFSSPVNANRLIKGIANSVKAKELDKLNDKQIKEKGNNKVSKHSANLSKEKSAIDMNSSDRHRDDKSGSDLDTMVKEIADEAEKENREL